LLILTTVAPTGDTRTAYSVSVGKLEGKEQLGKPRPRWKDNIKMHLTEIGWDDANRIIYVTMGTHGGFK
jgi:hypothetical protein